MIFEWRDIDGTASTVHDPQTIVERLEELRGRLDKAIGEDRTGDTAIITALWHDQYRQWNECDQRYMSSQREMLSVLSDQAYLRIDWWKEWLSPADLEAPASNIQLEVLGEHSDDLTPTTWKQASLAIAYLADFGVPRADDPEGAISAALLCFEKASAASLSAQNLVELRRTRMITEPEHSDHNSLLTQLREALAHVKTFVSAPS